MPSSPRARKCCKRPVRTQSCDPPYQRFNIGNKKSRCAGILEPSDGLEPSTLDAAPRGTWGDHAALRAGTLELGAGLEVLVSASLAILQDGDLLDVVVDSRSSSMELPAWARRAGHVVADERREGDAFDGCSDLCFRSARLRLHALHLVRVDARAAYDAVRAVPA